ncbi:MAG: hypothetical protein LBN93_10865 [Candidatus Symbiothrix sp.]|jgi:hypothetical protein|nr:hypothetical protein [Candidatus Symbiothrix sp.]
MNTQKDISEIKLAIWFEDNREDPISVTIKEYKEFVKEKEQKKIANFIYHRLYDRYLKPFQYDEAKYKKQYKKQYKNGFSIMANCCLLIEALQSFKNGWEDTNERGKSEKAFKHFFAEESNFSDLKSTDFYKNVRCGILHQGETTGGWKITRTNTNGEGTTTQETEGIFNSEQLVINAEIFMRKMNTALENYKKELETSEWDSEIWDNCRTKMRKIISNCESATK